MPSAKEANLLSKQNLNKFLRENIYHLMGGERAELRFDGTIMDWFGANLQLSVSKGTGPIGWEGIKILSSNTRCVRGLSEWQIVCSVNDHGFGMDGDHILVGFYGSQKSFFDWLMLAKLSDDGLENRDLFNRIKVP